MRSRSARCNAAAVSSLLPFQRRPFEYVRQQLQQRLAYFFFALAAVFPAAPTLEHGRKQLQCCLYVIELLGY